jgi:proteasome lid subunit RPN8/RPN11
MTDDARRISSAEQRCCDDRPAFIFLGTTVSVEAVDPVFQSNMVEMLKQTGRPEMVVGWYHSVRPSFIHVKEMPISNTDL